MKQEIIYNDEKYYVIFNVRNKTALSLSIVDETFLSVTEEIYNGVLNIFINKLDFDNMDGDEILSWIKNMKPKNEEDRKSSKGCAACIKICEYYLKRDNCTRADELKIMAIYLSCLRKLGFSQKAYDYFHDVIKHIGLISNATVLTSMAATCCDLNKYEEALKYANAAYAQQSGGVGYTNELALVYNRIRKESGLSQI